MSNSNIMSSKQIRRDFFDFFTGLNHTIVPSAPLLPVGDQTLLFTNAGMNQFKDIFLGQGKRDYTRAADTQKCMRVSGKHNDLDDVGKDTYHHTFFEMLGNWSFGDYYKKEVIKWAWQLLTERWALPKEKLYATVFREDREAFELWKQETDIDAERILYFDEKDNFWEMGDTGPCGPCSEIHIDLGLDSCDRQDQPGHKCGVNGDCGRFIELWNLVFIQYDRQKDGSLQELPAKHIDTGMGFERIVAVMQGKSSNYDTDLFVPIIEKISLLSNMPYESNYAVPMRVIADHIRALVFSIADGIMPSNDGRGYVIRRILRRALRFGQFLGLNKPFLGELLPVVIKLLGETFPELERNRVRILEVLNFEEERYFSTLQAGIKELERIIAEIRQNGKNRLDGEQIFQLYDSMGFPVDICAEIAEDEQLEFDRAGFDALMQEQKERGRQSWKGGSESKFQFLDDSFAGTVYCGDSSFREEGVVLAVFDEESTLKELTDQGYVIFDQTPFYAESGGQVADTGSINWDGGCATVTSVSKLRDLFIHQIKIEQGSLTPGIKVQLEVDSGRKAAVAANHSATHLLQQVLIEVLGDHVAQAGSLVDEDRLRFDFSHFKAIDRKMLNRVEQRVNGLIRANIAVSKEEMDKDTALDRGAKAFFGEKYGERVRVVSMGDFSVELCGGTHVDRTGDIGLFKIIQEFSVASGVRRVEAVTGAAAVKYIQKNLQVLFDLSNSLNVPVDELGERVNQLQERIKRLEKEVKQKKSAAAMADLGKLGEEAAIVNGVRVIVGRLDGAGANVLKEAVDRFKNQYQDTAVLLAGSDKNKCMVVLGASGKGLDCGIDARKLIKPIAAVVQGGGGGRADLAQAGGKDPSKIDQALETGKKLLTETLG